ncbi:MAG: hypothetical protein HXX09_02715 [Bacteroidetes bacterium]|nr:hypothetical protein [Bacteroidota bacterium]
MKRIFTFLVMIFVLFSISTNAQPLNGTYTVGGENPTYKTLKDAINGLVLNGIYGPVVLKIRDGIYTEQINFQPIPGTTEKNNITIVSESNDSTKVTYVFSPTQSENYVLKLFGCDYINFSKISFQSKGTDFASVVKIENGATFNSFNGCVFEGVFTNNITTDLSLVFEGDGKNNGNKFQNSVFKNGSIGLFFNTGEALVVYHNKFINQYYKGIELSYTPSVIVNENAITTSTGNNEYIAIDVQYSERNIVISNNRINFESGYYGIYLYFCNGTADKQGIIMNNCIGISGKTGTAYGIYVGYSNFLAFYHNTIDIIRPVYSSRAFSQSGSNSSGNLKLANNIFANLGGGFAMYVEQPASITGSNYNNLFTTGSIFGYWGSARKDFSEWKTASGKDANSISINPEFRTVFDCYAQSFMLDNKGIGIPEVIIDINGEKRDKSTPDIGAVEWAAPSNDAGIVSIDKYQTFCVSKNSVFVNLKNFGLEALKNVKINWSVNGVIQKPFVWEGDLGQSKTLESIKIGEQNFSLGKQYTVIAWTSNPNNSNDAFSFNDTAKVLNSYIAMTGNYTIGANGNYKNFKDAISDLERGGVCGNVVFTVKNGTYNEQITINEISGTNAQNTVKFVSETKDSTKLIIVFSPTSVKNNYTLRFNGCDFVTFSHMKIKSIGTIYSTAIRVENGSTNNGITNCILEGMQCTTNSIESSVLSEGPGKNTNNIIKNNNIINGSIGIYYSSGSGSVIEDNNYQNQFAQKCQWWRKY